MSGYDRTTSAKLSLLAVYHQVAALSTYPPQIAVMPDPVSASKPSRGFFVRDRLAYTFQRTAGSASRSHRNVLSMSDFEVTVELLRL